MLWDAFIIMATLGVLIFLHEIGHIIAAKIVGLHVVGFGVRGKPFPHAFVEVEWTFDDFKRNIYLFAGSAVTTIIFFFLLLNGFFNIKTLYYAVAIQLTLETNPFFSDFVFAYMMKRRMGKGKDYMFTPIWYYHFFAWTLFIFFLFSDQFLRGYFF